MADTQTFHCDIVSAEGSIFSGAVSMISAVGIQGELGVIAGHAPLLTQLEPGPLRIVLASGEEQVFYVSGGMLEVQPNLVSVLADSSERAQNVDEAAAQAAQEEALEALLNQKSELDYSLAAARLAEASAQLRTLQKLRR